MADEEENKENEEAEGKDTEADADDAGEENEDGEEGEGGGKKKKKGGSKLKLIIIALSVVIIIAVPAVLYLTGFFEKEHNENVRIETVEGEVAEEAASEEGIVERTVYYDMAEFIVNLNVGSQRPSFLKMTVSLELGGESQIPRVEEKMPKIRDSFQIYLRELRQEDLQGSAGLYRLREELLLRINKIVYPAKINDILFKEILVQ